MEFKHVIFDLDGTILDTLEDLALAGNHTCELHGWPTFAVDQYRYKVGNGMLKLVERFMPAEYAGDGMMFQTALAEFRSYYGEHKEDHTAPYPGIIDMLDAMREAGVTLAVLTNKDHAAAVPLIERYFGPDRFAVVQGRIDAYPAQACGARHPPCPGAAWGRPLVHALRGRFQRRHPVRAQRWHARRRRGMGLPRNGGA